MTQQSHKRVFNSTRPIDYGPPVMSSSGQYHELEQTLAGEHATVALGVGLAPLLRPGDLVCLNGGLGAGKTTLARAVIRTIAGDAALEVPSPSFAIAQLYDLKPPVAHFDFFRLDGPAEVEDTGLRDALGDRVVLLEWPDRSGSSQTTGSISSSAGQVTFAR